MTTFAARTDVGRRGGQNEDAIGWDSGGHVWFVADGMGGHAAGAVASQVVKETLIALAGSTPPAEAVLRAHEAVVASATENPAYAGMGATLVSVWVEKRVCRVVWVGDSRAYLWRKRALEPLTRDHSYLEELRKLNNLSETQLHNHPDRHLVVQTLGIGTPVPSVTETKLRAGDWVLLCSDGLTDELTDAEVARVLATVDSVQDGADALIRAALEKGGRDNVSVVLLAKDSSASSSGSRLEGATLAALAAAGGIGAALAIAAAWWYLNGKR